MLSRSQQIEEAFSAGDIFYSGGIWFMERIDRTRT